MIHPSYVELMKVVNHTTEVGEEPVVNSRYSIVIAAAKRARQLIAGDEPLVAHANGKKPLSTAVQEIYEGKVTILGESDDEPQEDEVPSDEAPVDALSEEETAAESE
jgi:DNA-directed RNA polymerase subunit omega